MRLLSFFLLVASSVHGFSPVTVSDRPASLILFSSKQDEDPVQEEVSRRVALVMAAATVAAGTNLPPALALPLSSQVEALEYENIALVNTKGAPEKHIPQTTVDGTSVQVVVPHVMDPEKPHWIEYVWLKDEKSNKVVHAKKFDATDASPPTLTATVKKGTTVTPLLFCNLHGLWQGDAVTV